MIQGGFEQYSDTVRMLSCMATREAKLSHVIGCGLAARSLLRRALAGYPVPQTRTTVRSQHMAETGA
jgi:hypothetical protein